MVEYKQCKKCHFHKPVSAFYRKSKGEGKLYSWCKQCMKHYAIARRKKDPKKYRDYMRTYMRERYKKLREHV